jgi:hypothetical protein
MHIPRKGYIHAHRYTHRCYVYNIDVRLHCIKFYSCCSKISSFLISHDTYAEEAVYYRNDATVAIFYAECPVLIAIGYEVPDSD